MERVIKVEKHWCLRMNLEVDLHTEEEVESMLKKLRAVLNGAEVIEMPSEEEISRESDYSAHKMDIDDGETPNSGLYWRGWGDAIRWLKSKIVK